ncbi:MAG: glycoside hydrolase family 97 protein, partial [Bacilli bacterium]|nr:glycoside hydrolase family 97 protein [Bacilli bacterium]
FSKGLTFVNATSDEKEFSYVCRSGKTNKVSVHYKEKVITTKVDDLLMDVTFRALNDGYGFQYTFRKEDASVSSLIWENEFTEFNLPIDSTTYGMDYVPNKTDKGTFYSYEEQYLTRPVLDIDYVSKVSFPFGYDANGYYSFITESALMGSGYHGSFLQKNDKGILATVEAPASGTDPDYSVALPFTSPWRVSCVGSYATAVETTIVEDIQGDIQEYVPEGESNNADYYDWVEPGPAAWNWYLHPNDQADYDLQKTYIDLAKDMGWKYTILDGGWEGNHSFSEQKELIDYAHNNGGKKLKVIVWAETMDKFGNEAKMRRTLDYYHELGVDGLKVDFWDGQQHTGLPHQMEDKQTIKQYDDFYKMTAEYHMVVNCHGCNKPTGEKRKYPHIINREAIFGNEMGRVFSDQGPINTVLRAAVGPTDFTPVVLPSEYDVTVGYQMALTVLYESGLPSMADLDETYRKDLYKDYFSRLPAAWDKTKFIDGTPKTYVVVARKKGDNWWVGGVTASKERNITVDLSFLDVGSNYSATFYTDNGSRGREATIEKETEIVTSTTKKLIHLSSQGGFAIELIKQQ